MKDVIHEAEDHTPLLRGIGVGQHKFRWCPVAEKSDVDAAEKNAKDFAGWLVAQSREEMAGAIAELKRRTESRLTEFESLIHQLRESKPDLKKVQELACRVQELEAKLELAEKGTLKTIRGDLETLENQVKEIMEQLPKPDIAIEPRLRPPADGNHYEDLEISLKKIELKLSDAVERIGPLEKRPVASDKTGHPSTFWRRVRWLLRGQ